MKSSTNSHDLVSIIVPVYNCEKYIKTCLDSALAQSYKNIEIICVNDGSNDDSLAILKDYASTNKNVTVFNQKNAGVVKARNKAISNAKGKYILPLDADDKIAPECVEKLLTIIKQRRCAVAAPGVEFFDKDSGVFLLPQPTRHNMVRQNCIVNCALFEKKYWIKYGGYDKRFNEGLEDYDFWLNFIQDNKSIVRSEEILFYYRIKHSSKSRNSSSAMHHERLISLMHDKYPRVKSILAKSQVPPLKKRIAHLSKNALKRSIRSTDILKWRDYKNYVLHQQLDKKDFVEITKSPYIRRKSDKKLIAYYLPQYYQIPQNDEWFGKGFTEWNNTSKTVPQYKDHWQPHLPIDVGFYNLETTHVMHRQIELAKMYGIHGFCFYYYWFSGGDKIMEKPINNWIADKNIDFPFMLFWANEDWTNTWGESADLGTKTYSAKMKTSDAKKFVADILPFLSHKNYITVDGRPHIIIYQALKDPHLPKFIKQIGELIQKEGLKKPYISLVFPDDSPTTFNPLDYGADAAVEFGVHMKIRPDHVQEPIRNKNLVNPLAKLVTYDMEDYVSNRRFIYDTDFPLYKGAMTTYDNTARKIYTNAYMFALSPKVYQEWLSELIKTSKTDTVFISAWNEWAEGMHLEPDHRFGYAYLQATLNALHNNQTNKTKD